MAVPRVTVNQAAVRQLAFQRGGAVERDLQRRARQVYARQKQTAPRKSGALLRSIHVETAIGPTGVYVRIGSALPQATYLATGTGIYGPSGRRIYPRRAQALRWEGGFTVRSVGAGGTTSTVHFARSIRGMRPNHFMRDSLQAAR